MPIYEDIARDLLEAIHRGQYPVGGLIPTELELAARYEVSRQTVRAAMRRLTELGAVSRRKGSGTPYGSPGSMPCTGPARGW